MGLLAAAAFLCVGVAVPLIISKVSGNTGDEKIPVNIHPTANWIYDF